MRIFLLISRFEMEMYTSYPPTAVMPYILVKFIYVILESSDLNGYLKSVVRLRVLKYT